MGFPARFPGTCRKCEQPIHKGEEISWSRRERGKAYHTRCLGESTPETPNETSSTVPDVPSTVSEPIVPASQENYSKQDHSDAFGVFASAIAPYLDGMLAAKVDETKVRAIVRESHKEARESLLAGLEAAILDVVSRVNPLTVRVQQLDGKVHEITGAHEKMPSLLYLVSKGHHVYLYGGPGSGKSTAAKQVADALDVRFGYISLNPQTPDSRLLGFIDANGTYRETVFYQLYRDGGVFCIDEMDNASPSLLTTLNSCLENGHAAFPCGMVPRHKDFVVVATGNTVGKGANPAFPERRPFDAAFSERFTFLQWEYDTKLERAITLSINPNAKTWLEWVWKTRTYCTKTYPRVLVSPRASFKGAEYLKDNVLSVSDIAESVVFKGLESATRDNILSNCPLPKASHE